MRMLSLLLTVFLFQSCISGNDSGTTAEAKKDPENSFSASSVPEQHQVIAKEIIQVSNYTYIKVAEAGKEYWLAAPSIEAQTGDTLYYGSGMLMTNFESKELKRTFATILFVDRISKTPLSADTRPVTVSDPHAGKTTAAVPPTGSPRDTVKQSVKIEPAENGLTIATILKDPKKYEGKTVRVKGRITKYTTGVMGKNWVHVQDGSSFNNKFELVFTTAATLKDGDTITFEGPVTLNKDLGFGYFFEILIEDAKIIR